MSMMTGQGVLSALVAVLALSAYLIGLNRTGRLRPLSTIALFCAAMALWQLGMALIYGLQPASYMNVVYGSAFLIMGAISQVAGAFQVREREESRETAPQALPAAHA
jgi:hypothetical protein